MITADGFDDCLLGMAQVNNVDVTVYSIQRIIQKLMDRDGMSDTEAVEFFEYNIQCAYLGEHTPIYVEEMDIDEVREHAYS